MGGIRYELDRTDRRSLMAENGDAGVVIRVVIDRSLIGVYDGKRLARDKAEKMMGEVASLVVDSY